MEVELFAAIASVVAIATSLLAAFHSFQLVRFQRKKVTALVAQKRALDLEIRGQHIRIDVSSSDVDSLAAISRARQAIHAKEHAA